MSVETKTGESSQFFIGCKDVKTGRSRHPLRLGTTKELAKNSALNQAAVRDEAEPRAVTHENYNNKRLGIEA